MRIPAASSNNTNTSPDRASGTSIMAARLPGKSASSPGFTLIEMLVVVVIVGVLALIAYPGYRDSVVKTRRAEGRAALAALMLEQERRFTAQGSYQLFSAASAQGFKWYSGATAQGSAYALSGIACQDEGLKVCIMLAADPGSEHLGGRHHDPACGRLTLDSHGIQGASGPGPGCW